MIYFSTIIYMDYRVKYLKYKNKYLELKKQLGGALPNNEDPVFNLLDAVAENNTDEASNLIDEQKEAGNDIREYINLVDPSNGDSALYIACQNRNIEMIKLLLNNGADANIGDIPIVRDLNFENEMLFVRSVNNGSRQWDSMTRGEQYYLERMFNYAREDSNGEQTPNPPQRPKRPLQAAIQIGHIEAIQLLINNGAVVKDQDIRNAGRLGEDLITFLQRTRESYGQV